MQRNTYHLTKRIGIGVLACMLATGMASRAAATVNLDNATSLQFKWDFPLSAGVTASPVVANGLVYAGAWDGVLYALDRETGSLVWSFDTGSGSILGIQSTVLVRATGDVCFGDSASHVWCRDGLTGAPVWDKLVGDSAVDHIWSGLAESNGRMFVSIASHSDQPCTKGRLVVLDATNGADIWSLQTVPNKVCSTDTGTVCIVDADCPSAGTCVDAVGAGVTATVSFDATGSSVYMNTVGCFTFPSVGDSDSIFKIDAATGAVIWKTRVDAPEQFGACSNDPSIDCGTDAECGAGNTCDTKSFYHDFGFLNGPNPVDVPSLGKTLLVSGSKNGTLYALDEATGAIEWSNQVVPKPVTPDFAGFGLFNGPLAIADGRIFAALYDFSPSITPAPDHMQAFDLATGASLWTSNMGISWSGIGTSNGVVFTGNNAFSGFRMFDAATGAPLGTRSLGAATTSVARADGNDVYIGYGIFGGSGGIRAFEIAAPSKTGACLQTVNKQTAKFAQQKAKALCKCEVLKLKGKIPSTTVCSRDDLKTTSKIGKAAGKRTAKIDATCGGSDKICGADLAAEVGADRIGFSQMCPGFESMGQCSGGTNDTDLCSSDGDCSGGGVCVKCDTAILADECTGVDTCLGCVASAATRQMDDVLITDLAPTDPAAQKAENLCQQEIQKSTWKFFNSKSKILQKCWDKRIKGKHTDTCPDAAAATGSDAKIAADKIAQAQTKMRDKICKRCGGGDQVCGGGDDLAISSLYAPAPTCPSVTLPSTPFTDCGSITISNIADLVDCLQCVAEFKIDCTTANQVPSIVPYPAACAN